MLCKKTLIMAVSELQTLTEGVEYEALYDDRERLYVLNDQGDVHHFPTPYLEEYFE